MIAYIEGRLAERWGNSCLIITQGGVGYAVALPAHTWASLPAAGEPVALYTSLAVREDAQELFGFASFAERETFEMLTSISRVGARTALAVLSTFRPEELRRLVQGEDAASLARVPGIGKKTAQHVLLELKYKLKAAPCAPQGEAAAAGQSQVMREALSALANLGYSEEECAPLLHARLQAEPDLDVTAALRATLKALAQGREHAR